ncbi:MAG: FAD binding domain-containing protein [Acidimicrobiales bacterium]
MAATFETHPVQRAGRSISAILRPATVDEAVQLLAHDSTRRPLAGGSDILLELHRGGPGSPVELIDLTAIEGFDRIEEADNTLRLGGGVRHGQVVSDRRFIERATPLAQACFEIGSPQLRNRATIAGNLVTASPANDSLSALIALGARLQLSRWNGSEVVRRWVDVDRFFTGFRTTVLADDELITEIEVPTLGEGMRGLWVKVGNRRAQAISVVHAGFVVRFEDGRVRDGRMAFGSVAPVVKLAEAGTALLADATLDDGSIAEIARSVMDEFTPIDDVRATADYRKQVLGTLVQRALTALRDGTHRDRWPADSPRLASSETSRRPAPGPSVIDNATAISATVNGKLVSADGAASASLLDWLRDRGSLEGTKEGCAEGECGACTVQLDGAAVMSCIVQAAQADGADITTVEGLATDDELHPIQQAFIDEFAVQCGFCIPGFLVAGAALLDEFEEPDEEQIRLGLSGNLCRCTGYYPMVSAVKLAAQDNGGDPA